MAEPPLPAPPAPTGWRAWRWTIAAAVYGLGYVALHRGHADDAFVAAIGRVGLLPVALLVLLLALRVATKRSPRGHVRQAFMLLSAAFAFAFLGDASRVVLESVFGIDPRATAYAAPSLLAYPLALLAFVRLSGRSTQGSERLRTFLDQFTVLTSVGVLVSHYVAMPKVAAGSADVVTLLHPVGGVAALMGVATLLLRRATCVPRGTALALAAGTIFALVRSGLAPWLELRGVHAMEGLSDPLWLACNVAYVAAAERQIAAFGGDAQRHPTLANPDQRLHPLPYLTSALAYFVLVLECWVNRRTAPWDLAMAATAITVAVIARQLLAVRDNARLSKERAELLGEARLSALVRHAADAIWILDAEGRVRWASPSTYHLVGLEPDRLVGTPFPETFAAADREWASSFLQRAMVPSPLPVRGEGRLAMPGREAAPRFEIALTNLSDDPHVGGVVANLHDVTERARLQEELSHQAFHDALTGLPNRALLHDRVGHALARSLRGGRPMAVILVDLDHFKDVNDGLGHGAGDALLVKTARRMKDQLRDVDTAARIGGDEFAVVAEGLTREQAVALAERLCVSLQAPFEIEGRAVSISASLGVTVAAPGDTCETLLRNADTAMYAAKASGRAAVRLFEETMYVQARENLELQNELRADIERERLRLDYQPIVDLATGDVVGVEALARWTHPVRGRIAPDRFIALAEATGLIVPLGRLLLARALDEMTAAQPMWPSGRPPILFLNVSARQLEDVEFVPTLRRELIRTSFDPSRLCLELTESLFMRRADHVPESLEQLRQMGVLVGIDDFGTGYSSLSYLHTLPLDVLKIPREFTERLGTGGDSEVLAQSILALAKAMNLRTIGEGIETDEQLQALRRLGCEMGQGFFLARPAPIPELLAALRRNPGRWRADGVPAVVAAGPGSARAGPPSVA